MHEPESSYPLASARIDALLARAEALAKERDEILVAIGAELRTLRQSVPLAIGALAGTGRDKSGVCFADISLLERGRGNKMTPERVRGILRAIQRQAAAKLRREARAVHRTRRRRGAGAASDATSDATSDEAPGPSAAVA